MSVQSRLAIVPMHVSVLESTHLVSEGHYSTEQFSCRLVIHLGLEPTCPALFWQKLFWF